MGRTGSIREGEKIYIEVDEGNKVGQYLSKVEEVIDEHTYTISDPTVGDQYAYLFPGQVIRVVYFKKEAMYYFKAEVIERMRLQKAAYIRLKAVSDRYKLQRRNYYRLDIMVPVIVVTDEAKREAKRFDTIDISGGGVRIASNMEFDRGIKISMFIGIPGIEKKIIKGRIVRSEKAPKEFTVYETAIEFIDISPDVRQIIIQYVFEKQRELIKRGFQF